MTKSTIYCKISLIQQKLLKEQFKTKKGFHGEYIPLKEMLPQILKECSEQELTMYFTSTSDHMILKLMSFDGKEEFSARVRLPELTSDEKKEGARITYLKRYLLMNTFMIIEDSVDPDDLPDDEHNNAPSDKDAVDINVPSLIVEAEKKLQSKGVDDKDITPQSLKMTVRKLKRWTPSEMRVINNYFKVNDLCILLQFFLK